jgi:hypothetical protein
LEGNLIVKIEGLQTLFNLLYLNLANNKIEELEYRAIPKEIAILKIGGNPCTNNEGYRKELIEYFELLDELDGISVVRERFLNKGLEYPFDELESRPSTYRSDGTESTNVTENFRFMNEDEDLHFAMITEATWGAVLKSRERVEELMKARLEFSEKMKKSRKK